jgi:hypothetical protein
VRDDRLREEIAVELQGLEVTVQELLALGDDLRARQPTLREKTAAAAFLAQFYNGIENILKRISLYAQVSLPIGETWHIELFQRFCAPPHPGLPVLFDADLASALAPYRRFRHVAFHSYAFQLDWSRMAEGVAGAGDVFSQFEASLSSYLATLED